MPAWIAVVVIGREFLVTDLRVVAAAEGFTIQARDLGKWKMGVQIAAVLACILGRKWPVGDIGLGYVYLPLPIEWIGKITVWGMVVLSVLSAVDYFVVFWNKIDQAAKQHRHRRPQRAPASVRIPRCGRSANNSPPSSQTTPAILRNITS